MNALIELGAFGIVEDELKQQSKVPVYRSIFAEELPIRMSEFHVAAQMGIKAERAYRVWEMEYAGEQMLRADGVVYRIYRVYRDTKAGKTELYCEVRLGGS